MAGEVTRRPGESRSSWRRRVRVAQNVEKFGWRVYCGRCFHHYRWRPADGPFLYATCPRCGIVGETKRANLRARPESVPRD